MNRLSSQHNKTIRIMNFKKYDDPTPTAELFKNKNILPVEQNVNYLESKFIWKIINNTQCVPKSIINIFDKHGSVSVRDGVTKVHLPFKRTDYGQRFITYSGIRQWRKLPIPISSIMTSKCFNKSLKLHLLNSIERDVAR